jgi:hypothetical protein
LRKFSLKSFLQIFADFTADYSADFFQIVLLICQNLRSNPRKSARKYLPSCFYATFFLHLGWFPGCQHPTHMKKYFLILLAILLTLSGFPQKPRIKNGIIYKNYQAIPRVDHESSVPLKNSSFRYFPKQRNFAGQPNAVTVLNLGTSSNVLSYSGGTRTMLWADDDLNCVVNIHRMGPGATPPSLSGYLGMDIGLNMGKTQADWTTQVQVYAANLSASPNYYDAARYPSAGIYNPAGNTTLSNAFLAYFAPNFANLAFSGFGGYSYGTANLLDHADTTKHLKWYSPPPYTFVPEGFTVSKTGIAHMVNLSKNAESGTDVYQDSVIYGRGIWNSVTKDFDYTFRTLAFPCKEAAAAADCKIATSPDGTVVWISVLTNWAGANIGVAPLIDSTYYPLLRRSTDCGLTWGPPIPVYLDGPLGISGIKNHYSDYFIQNFFVGPPYPSRDEIPYTCAFDHSLSVDKWGNPHIGVVVGYAPGGYSISTGVDSLLTVYDINSPTHGASWCAVAMGSLTTFRGTWATYTSDNRTYISRNKAGDKMFLTWNDTHIDGEINNQNPDVFARGVDLITNKITLDNGLNKPNNVTLLSDIAQEAYWQCSSPYVFTDNNKFTIPICTQWFADASADVTFKYIPDFSFEQSAFLMPSDYCWFDSGRGNDPGLEIPEGNYLPCYGVAVDQKPAEPELLTISPNPADDKVKISVYLKREVMVDIEISDLFGKTIKSIRIGGTGMGLHTEEIDISGFAAGVYVVSVVVDGERMVGKLVVQ